MLTADERREAGRTVWRHLNKAGGWVDEVFIGWPHLDRDILAAGLEELGARGLTESRFDTKRVQVRLRPRPADIQLTIQGDTTWPQT